MTKYWHLRVVLHGWYVASMATFYVHVRPYFTQKALGHDHGVPLFGETIEKFMDYNPKSSGGHKPLVFQNSHQKFHHVYC